MRRMNDAISQHKLLKGRRRGGGRSRNRQGNVQDKAANLHYRVALDVVLAPSNAGGPSPPTPPKTPPPTPDWAALSRTPRALQKEPRGVGGRGREKAGREGLWLEGRVLQLQWGMGGGPSKHQLGPDPHLGAPNITKPHLCLFLIGDIDWGVSRIASRKCIRRGQQGSEETASTSTCFKYHPHDFVSDQARMVSYSRRGCYSASEADWNACRNQVDCFRISMKVRNGHKLSKLRGLFITDPKYLFQFTSTSKIVINTRLGSCRYMRHMCLGCVDGVYQTGFVTATPSPILTHQET